MTPDIVFSPVLPLAVIAVLGLLGLALIVAGALARARGWPLRLLTLAVLALALLNPSIRNEDRDYLPDIAVVIADRSQSQESGDRLARTDAAEAAVKEAAQRLGATELRSITARSGIAADEDGTRLFKLLDEALADIPPERFAGAILITDGQVHDVPPEIPPARYGAPIHALVTGDPDEVDRRIVVEQAPRFGIVGREQTIRFRIDEAGGGSDPIEVTVRAGTGEPLTLNVAPGESVELPLLIDHGGQNIAEISAGAAPGEITLQNNRAVAAIEGIRDRLRVLLVSGEPHPGERTWRNLLKADASVDLVHFTILRPPEKQDGTPIKELSLIAFPTRELFVEKLEEFDLIVFDRYQRQGVLPLAYLANVSDYVEKGGAVLLAAGPDYASPSGLYSTPLSAILTAVPTGEVLEGPFKPAVTDKGRRHPVTRGLVGSEGPEPTWGRWFRQIDADPGSGETVMSGNGGKPLLVLARTGEGRVAQLLSDHGWLWARGFEGGGPQTELLRRIAHWLMKEPDLEEEALSGRQEQRQLVVERRTTEDAAEPVTVTMPSGKTAEIALTESQPGVWTGRTAAAEAGVHRLNSGTLSAVAAVGSADPKEMTEVVATDAKLRPAAQATGGGIAWLGKDINMPQLVKTGPGRQMSGSGWLGLKANGAYRVRAVSEIPLFATLASLGLALALLCGLWYREGR